MKMFVRISLKSIVLTTVVLIVIFVKLSESIPNINNDGNYNGIEKFNQTQLLNHRPHQNQTISPQSHRHHHNPHHRRKHSLKFQPHHRNVHQHPRQVNSTEPTENVSTTILRRVISDRRPNDFRKNNRTFLRMTVINSKKRNGRSELDDEWHDEHDGTTSRPGGFNSGPTTSVIEKRVCSHQRTVLVPYHTSELYHKPILRQYTEPCHGQQTCTGVRMVNEPAYRTVIKHRTVKQVIFTCCHGWEKESPESTGCDKPICGANCKNGGTCVKPDTCQCLPGYEGKFCDRDINECKLKKPCDQFCYNTEGSYYCTCRDGFVLQNDQQSCRKVGGFNHDEDAFETRDLETNDLDYEEISNRLDKLETMMKMDKKQLTYEVDKKLNSAMDTMSSLLVRIDSIEHRQYDMTQLKDKLKSYDLQTKRLNNMVDYLFKCRSGTNPDCN